MSRTLIRQFFSERYRIEEQIGAHSFYVRDPQNRPCVIKILSSESLTDWQSQAYLKGQQRQLLSLDDLNHPQLPKLYTLVDEVFKGQEVHAFVRSFIPGKNLRERGTQLLSAIELRSLLNQVLDILIVFQKYSPPLLHGDLSPERILVDSDLECHILPGPGLLTQPEELDLENPYTDKKALATPRQDLQSLGQSFWPLYKQEHSDTALKRWLNHAKEGKFKNAQQAKEALNRSTFREHLLKGIDRYPTLSVGLAIVLSVLLIIFSINGFKKVSRMIHADEYHAAQAQKKGDKALRKTGAKLSYKYDYLQADAQKMPAPWQKVPYKNHKLIYDITETDAGYWFLSPLSIWFLPHDLNFPEQHSYWNQADFRGYERSYIKSFTGSQNQLFVASTGPHGFLKYGDGQSWKRVDLPFTETSILEMQGLIHQGKLILGLKHQIWAYDLKSNEWKHLAQTATDQSYARINALASGPDGSLWIAVYNRLLQYKEGQLQQRAQLQHVLQDLAIAPSGELYLGGSDRVFHFRPGGKPEQMIQGIQLKDMLSDTAGGLWLATADQGLHYYDPTKQSWQNWKRNIGMPSEKLESLYLDRQDRLWVGSQDAGAWFASRQAILSSQAQPPPSLALKEADCICTLAADEFKGFDSGDIGKAELKEKLQVYIQGRHIYAEDRGQLGGYKRQGDQVIHRIQSKVHYWDGQNWQSLDWPGKAGQNIYASLYDSQGRIWIHTSGHKSYVYAQGQWHLLFSEKNYQHTRFYESPDGRVYIGRSGHYDSALYVMDAQVLQAHEVPASHLKAILIEPLRQEKPGFVSIEQMRQAGDRLWLVSDKTLWYRANEQSPWQSWSTKAGQPLQRILDLRPDPQGEGIWLAGQGGLAYYKAGRFWHWDSRQGLLADDLTALGFDAQGRLWLSDTHQRGAIYKPADLFAAVEKE